MRYSQASRCGKPSLALVIFFVTHVINSIVVLENVPTDAGKLKRYTFSTLNAGLDGTGNKTQDNWVASSGNSSSGIH
jgi:hypothetical protein